MVVVSVDRTETWRALSPRAWNNRKVVQLNLYNAKNLQLSHAANC